MTNATLLICISCSMFRVSYRHDALSHVTHFALGKYASPLEYLASLACYYESRSSTSPYQHLLPAFLSSERFNAGCGDGFFLVKSCARFIIRYAIE